MSVFVLNFVLVGMFVLPNLLQLATVIHLIMENLHKVIVIRDRTPTENRRKVSAHPSSRGVSKPLRLARKLSTKGSPNKN